MVGDANALNFPLCDQTPFLRGFPSKKHTVSWIKIAL